MLVLLGLILLSLVLACGGGPNHHATGFQYWHDPGSFAPYVMTGATGKFLGFWSVLTTAVFAYLGTELIGVVVGECANPRKAIPRAIKLTFFRILLFYIVLVFLLTMILPYNSPLLKTATGKSASAAASPFVVAIQISGIKVLPGLLNACILIFVFSTVNSGITFISLSVNLYADVTLDLYIASRTLYGIAVEGNAPRFLTYTDKRGVPVFTLGISSLFLLLAFLNVNTASATVFTYFVNLVTIFGLLTWISILVSYIGFIRARKA